MTSPEHRRGRPSYPVEVVEAAPVTPSMRRLTFEGEGLAGLEVLWPAQWMNVVLASPGGRGRVIRRAIATDAAAAGIDLRARSPFDGHPVAR